MIKVEVVENFSLKAFGELKNVVRFNPNKNEKGKLYEKDTFDCSQEMCEYLTGSNPLNKVVVKIIEVETTKVEPLTDSDEIETTIDNDVKDELPKTKVEFKPKKKKK